MGLRLEALDVPGVAPIDLALEAGEIVTLRGASGSGKTRLLRAIADLDEHTGRALLDGVACDELDAPDWRRRVGMLPAESAWWHARAADHFGSELPAGFEELGLTRVLLERPVAALSTGERQRLALLRLLAGRPRALLLDEPTSNLDAESARRVEDWVRAYCAETRACALWVTHDEAQAQRVGKRRYELGPGGLREVARA